MNESDSQNIRQLFDDYIQMYSQRKDYLTTHFSDDFSVFTGGGDFLVKDRNKWVSITRQDLPR
jgi:two-component system, cell cycle sensor histidine kinase and response regulator CckA